MTHKTQTPESDGHLRIVGTVLDIMGRQPLCDVGQARYDAMVMHHEKRSEPAVYMKELADLMDHMPNHKPGSEPVSYAKELAALMNQGHTRGGATD